MLIEYGLVFVALSLDTMGNYLWHGPCPFRMSDFVPLRYCAFLEVLQYITCNYDDCFYMTLSQNKKRRMGQWLQGYIFSLEHLSSRAIRCQNTACSDWKILLSSSMPSSTMMDKRFLEDSWYAAISNAVVLVLLYVYIYTQKNLLAMTREKYVSYYSHSTHTIHLISSTIWNIHNSSEIAWTLTARPHLFSWHSIRCQIRRHGHISLRILTFLRRKCGRWCETFYSIVFACVWDTEMRITLCSLS